MAVLLWCLSKGVFSSFQFPLYINFVRGHFVILGIRVTFDALK